MVLINIAAHRKNSPPPTVPASHDENVLDEAAFLADHAHAIRTLNKQTHRNNIENAIETGRRLTECKRVKGHGGFMGWFVREFKEFDWTIKTAERFMSVYAL